MSADRLPLAVKAETDPPIELPYACLDEVFDR
jgi:hypothetical protein